MRLWSRLLFLTISGGLIFTGPTVQRSLSAEDALPYTTWSSYLGTPDSAQYSALKQIHKSNVQRLKVAWTYPTGEGKLFRFGPLVARGVMYAMTGSHSIVALDA